MATGEGPTRFAIGVLEDATDAAAFRTAIGASGGATGDVSGPASSVDDRIATFDGITGKVIQDSGTLISGLVTTVDSRLSDARTPTAHTHPASEISDSTAAGRSVLTAADAAAQRTALGLGAAALAATLDAVPAPVAAVSFNGQQATSFRIENLTSDPGSPTVGQIWLRTDL